MKIRKIQTRFMDGNIDVDGEITDLLSNIYGWNEIIQTGITFDDVIYSNGFINAIENGKLPTLDIQDSSIPKKDEEYHHFIFNDNVYIMYFND